MVDANPQTQQQHVNLLIQSIVGPLMNKVKLIIQNPQKNKQLAQNVQLQSLIDLLAEQLLPQYCAANKTNYDAINLMHNLCYLFASKVQSVFNSGIIRTCIDQNWDLKGFRAVILRILKIMNITDTDLLTGILDKMVQSQNLQSQACIKAISYFLKNANKPIEEDDLRNPILSYSTTFEFLEKDILQFRSQKMKYECFTVLHPWAYDIDTVDFKYIVNKDQVKDIHRYLKDEDASVFWLSFFKAQLSCTADEFFNALKEVCEINLIPTFFDQNLAQYKKDMLNFEGAISLKQHKGYIKDYIKAVVQEGLNVKGYNALRDQIRTHQGIREPTELIHESKIKFIQIADLPTFDFLANHQGLNKIKLHQISSEDFSKKLDLQKQTFKIRPSHPVAKKLSLKFTNVDTEELKDTEINFDGNLAFFKVGEGDNNHFQIANDKKLWESQFMIICKNGQFFIRDLGVVHTSRIKVEKGMELQLQQGTMVDLGKVVHYHFDKVTHKGQPVTQSSESFIIMRPGQNYIVDSDDDAQLRGRQTWVSGDENKEMAQNEILIEASAQKNVFTVGRSIRRDVEIKLKAVSADHCTIGYSIQKGWIIHESGKDKLSSNGTFVFMKSMSQMDNHEPSDMIPLTNGMIISFINYELQVRIENKGPGEEQLFEEVAAHQTPGQKQQQAKPQVQQNQDHHQQDQQPKHVPAKIDHVDAQAEGHGNVVHQDVHALHEDHDHVADQDEDFAKTKIVDHQPDNKHQHQDQDEDQGVAHVEQKNVAKGHKHVAHHEEEHVEDDHKQKDVVHEHKHEEEKEAQEHHEQEVRENQDAHKFHEKLVHDKEIHEKEDQHHKEEQHNKQEQNTHSQQEIHHLVNQEEEDHSVNQKSHVSLTSAHKENESKLHESAAHLHKADESANSHHDQEVLKKDQKPAEISHKHEEKEQQQHHENSVEQVHEQLPSAKSHKQLPEDQQSATHSAKKEQESDAVVHKESPQKKEEAKTHHQSEDVVHHPEVNKNLEHNESAKQIEKQQEHHEDHKQDQHHQEEQTIHKDVSKASIQSHTDKSVDHKQEEKASPEKVHVQSTPTKTEVEDHQSVHSKNESEKSPEKHAHSQQEEKHQASDSKPKVEESPVQKAEEHKVQESQSKANISPLKTEHSVTSIDKNHPVEIGSAHKEEAKAHEAVAHLQKEESPAKKETVHAYEETKAAHHVEDSSPLKHSEVKDHKDEKTHDASLIVQADVHHEASQEKPHDEKHVASTEHHVEPHVQASAHATASDDHKQEHVDEE